MVRLAGSTAIITIAAIFGLFFPSSLGGTISLQLSRAAMVLNALILAWLLARSGPIDRTQMGLSLGQLLWMSAITLVSSQADFSAGALFIFIGLAILVAIKLDRIAAPGPWLLWGINTFVLIVGVGLSLNVPAANEFVKTYYTAFYQDLMVSMLDWHHKPVLTFATHSTAGFFYYLFFWLNFRTFRTTRSLLSLAWTVVVLAIGCNVRSTTSTVLMAVAAVQLVIDLIKRMPIRVRWPALVLAMPVGAILAITIVPPRLAALVQFVEGNQTTGLRSRYSTTGMLGGNLRYLNESPFSPIGFTYGPEDLFYGDSGFVLVMVRGSLPLLILVYLAYGRFLYRNLRTRGDAHCLFLVTCAFEVGYVPLQLFRFTSFLPFMIVYLNNLATADTDGAELDTRRGVMAPASAIDDVGVEPPGEAAAPEGVTR